MTQSTRPNDTINKRDPERNMARFYAMRVEATLFGHWALIREWGRIGSPGQVRRDWFDDQVALEQAAARITDGKLRKGYR